MNSEAPRTRRAPRFRGVCAEPDTTSASTCWAPTTYRTNSRVRRRASIRMARVVLLPTFRPPRAELERDLRGFCTGSVRARDGRFIERLIQLRR